MKTEPETIDLIQEDIAAVLECVDYDFEQAKRHEETLPAYRRVRSLMAAASELADVLETTVEYLEESHRQEIDDEHGGDEPGTCSYCKAIEAARAALGQALP